MSTNGYYRYNRRRRSEESLKRYRVADLYLCELYPKLGGVKPP